MYYLVLILLGSIIIFGILFIGLVMLNLLSNFMTRDEFIDYVREYFRLR